MKERITASAACPVSRPAARSIQGFSIIELLIALGLGLVVVGAAVAVFLSNKDSYRTNLALGQVQENSRIAFELLSREFRQAGITGCGNANRVANVLNNGTSAGGTVAWYADYGNVIRGFDGGTADPAVTSGTASGQRIQTTSSVTLMGAAMASGSIASYNTSTFAFTLTGANPGIQSGDIVIVCDPSQAVLAQVTSLSAGALAVNAGTTTPGNCSRGLGFPTQCATVTGNSYVFAVNAMMSLLSASDWYIGNNPLGGRSLYRLTLTNVGGVPTPTPQEMVRNVTDMQITYHVAGAATYVTAADVAGANNWRNVDAVQINLRLQGAERFTGTDGQPITRQFSTTVNLRNRI